MNRIVRFVDFARPQRISMRIAVVVAVLAVVASIAIVAVQMRSGSHRIAAAFAADSFRNTEARASIRMPYRPLRAVKRGAAAPVQSWRLATIATSLAEEAKSEPSRAALHELGVAYLLAAQPKQAVDSLESAVKQQTSRSDVADAIAASTDAQLLSDLAAAYLARSVADDDLDTLAALNTVERAWTLSHAEHVAWNRALAMSAASWREAAMRAWNDYLELDAHSGWATEASDRLRAVERRGPVPREIARTALTAALRGTSAEAVNRAVALAPGIARVYGEEEMLPSWGRGDDDALQQAARIGKAVAAISGDSLLADSATRIAALDPPQRDVARAALRDFGTARGAMNLYRYDEALPVMTSSASRLHSLGVPLSARATMYVATLQFYSKQIDASLATCSGLVRGNDVTRYPTIAAQCAWNEATIGAGQRQFDRARAAYETARAMFARMNDAKSVAAIDVRLEDNLRWTGDIEGAWSHMVRAFRNGAAERGYLPLSEAAKVAEASRYPFAALAFHEAALGAAEHANAAPELTDGHLSRAHLLAALGREDEARVELNAASRAMLAIRDARAAARLEGDLDLERASLTLTSRPERAAATALHAIGAFTTTGNRRKVAEARLLVARASRMTGDRESAARACEAALAEIEVQRLDVASDEERLALVGTARRATEELVSLLAADGRTQEALLASERLRGRVLRDALQVQPAERLSAPAAGEAFVSFFVLPERVLVWTSTPRETRMQVVDIDRPKLAREMFAWQSALATNDAARVRTLGSALFDRLLRPVWNDIAAAPHLVFCLDGPLQQLTPAALRASADRYLVEDHEISVVPSLSWLKEARRRTSAGKTHASLVVAPLDAASSLPRLRAAEQDAHTIASLLPGAVLLASDDVRAETFAADAAAADVIVFSGHALMDERRPARSALVLSNGASLHASDIAQWRLARAPLVMLAACDTASGRATADGAASLARSFLVAGAHAVIATGWAVDDEPASELSVHLCLALRSGAGARAALRTAQLAMLRDPSSARHFDWTAFQYIGP